MTLRNKTLSIIAIVFLVLVLGLVGVIGAYTGLLGLWLENADVARQTEAVTNALRIDLAGLATLGSDWTQWDDTYQFVQDGNAAYVDINLPPEAVINRNLNLMVFLNARGEIMHAVATDLEVQVEVSPPDEALMRAALPEVFDAPTKIEPLSGYIIIDGTAMEVAANPVLPSSGVGPASGAVILARNIDDFRLQQLDDILGVPLSIVPHDAIDLPSEVLANPEPVTLVPLDTEYLDGYALVRDIAGEPLFFVRATFERIVLKRFVTTLLFIALALVIGGIVMAVVLSILLERELLSRLRYLSTRIDMITRTGDVTLPVRLTGRDELSELAAGIQSMLDWISGYQAQLQQSRDELENRVALRTEELSETNVMLRQEVADRKRAEARLEEARDLALDQLSLKNQVLANISHDARTPLSVIVLQIEALQKEYFGSLNQKQKEIASRIGSSAERLNGFLDTLLHHAELQTKKVVLKQESFDLSDTVSDLVAQLRPLAEKKGLELTVQSDSVACVGDSDQVKRILQNLVTNAIKFTERGSVFVRATQSDGGMILISVTDTGIGIPEDARSLVFEPFTQAEYDPEGFGLGLSIVHQLVTLMGGRVWFESELAVGTTFSLELPLVNNREEARVNA